MIKESDESKSHQDDLTQDRNKNILRKEVFEELRVFAVELPAAVVQRVIIAELFAGDEIAGKKAATPPMMPI